MENFSGVYAGELNSLGVSTFFELELYHDKSDGYKATLSVDEQEKIVSSNVFYEDSYITAYFSEVDASVSLSLTQEKYTMTWRSNGAVIDITNSDTDLPKNASGIIVNDSNNRDYIFQQEKIGPKMITMLPTYRCNAACENCCFESNPKISTRLTRNQMISRVQMILDSFPDIQLLVLSGGEQINQRSEPLRI